MHTFRIVAALLALTLLVLNRPPLADAQGRAAGAVPGELIVKYKPGSDPAARGRARGRVKAALKRQHRVERGTANETVQELVSLPDGSNLTAAAAALAEDPSVEFAEPNWIYRHFATPNDPRLSQQWGLHNTGQVIAGREGGNADADVDALEAWSASTGSQQVYVGVIDEGIDVHHQDLGADPSGPIWTNPYEVRDGIDNDRNGYIDDIHGFDFAANDNTVYDGGPGIPWFDAHGTHVAGTIGARTNNGIGVAGVAWDVRIIAARFLTPDGGTTDNAVRAVDYLVDLKLRHGLNIVAINASWGGGGYSQALLEAIARAARAEILFIAAAGNGGPDYIGDDNDQVAHYPANYDTTALAGYDSVVTVAATGQWDDLPQFSNYGVRGVDLGAPGVAVLSTTPQNGYSYSNGTSMAAPHVTGAAVLVHAATGLTGRALRTRLLSTTDIIPSLRSRTATGGRLNIRAALGGSTTSTAPAPSPAPLAQPWRSQDIGSVGAAGNATGDGSAFTVTGAGADVWGTADGFHFAYRPLQGDGTIVARVSSLQYVSNWTKAGVMIRASLSPSSPHAFMVVTPGKGLAFQRRPSDGALSVSTAGALVTAPRWVKLTRAGDLITAFESADGVGWTQVGSSVIALPSTALVGLAVTSHVAGTTADARFDNVGVSTGQSPIAWSSSDVGSVGQAGSSSVGSTFTVTGSGTDIWGNADQFHFVHTPISGDVSIVARVATIQHTHAWAKAGVMVRESLADDSRHALMLVTPGGTKGLAFQRRAAPGGISTTTSGGSGTAPNWVKLERSGSVLTAYRSADGVNWTLVGSDTITMGSTVYVGLAVSSHDNAVLATATFDNVTVTAR